MIFVRKYLNFYKLSDPSRSNVVEYGSISRQDDHERYELMLEKNLSESKRFDP